MKIAVNAFNCNGFLIIELIVTLGLLAMLVLMIGKYQLQVRLYWKAAQQLYAATSVCENRLEQILAGMLPVVSQTENIQGLQITIVVRTQEHQAFSEVEVAASWQNAFKNRQTIRFFAIC